MECIKSTLKRTQNVIETLLPVKIKLNKCHSGTFPFPILKILADASLTSNNLSLKFIINHIFCSPSHKSTPGECYSLRLFQIFCFDQTWQFYLRIAIGNKTDQVSSEQMDNITIFLHVPGKFIYFVEQDHMPNNYKIYNLKLKWVGPVKRNKLTCH